MGRGKLLRTKVKAEKALVKARLQAQKEWEERKSNFAYGMKKEFVALLRKVDPIELLAIGGATFVVYNMLSTMEQFVSEFVARARKSKEVTPMIELFSYNILRIINFFGVQVEPEEKPDLVPDHALIIISFTLATILVRHPEVFTEMFSGVTKLSGFALGLLS